MISCWCAHFIQWERDLKLISLYEKKRCCVWQVILKDQIKEFTCAAVIWILHIQLLSNQIPPLSFYQIFEPSLSHYDIMRHRVCSFSVGTFGLTLQWEDKLCCETAKLFPTVCSCLVFANARLFSCRNGLILFYFSFNQ